MNDDSANVKPFEIEKLIAKRLIKRDVKYLIKWLKCESKKNDWKNLSEFNNVMNLIQKFESVHFESSTIIFNSTIKRDREGFKKVSI